MAKKSKVYKKTKAEKIIVVIRTPDLQIGVFEFPTAKLAREFADEAREMGAQFNRDEIKFIQDIGYCVLVCETIDGVTQYRRFE
jgi:F420-dependent methylenetetrahydromethanopterin dehydrogenase